MYFFMKQFRARNSTDCWYWQYQTEEVKPIEFYSKLPFPVSFKNEIQFRHFTKFILIFSGLDLLLQVYCKPLNTTKKMKVKSLKVPTNFKEALWCLVHFCKINPTNSESVFILILKQ